MPKNVTMGLRNNQDIVRYKKLVLLQRRTLNEKYFKALLEKKDTDDLTTVGERLKIS